MLALHNFKVLVQEHGTMFELTNLHTLKTPPLLGGLSEPIFRGCLANYTFFGPYMVPDHKMLYLRAPTLLPFQMFIEDQIHITGNSSNSLAYLYHPVYPGATSKIRSLDGRGWVVEKYKY